MTLLDRKPSVPYHASVSVLLDTLASSKLLYCHFKSNQHVAKGMCGDTDLDILADRESHSEITAALVSSGFKLFRSGPITYYPAVEDWLGIDVRTGKLAHLHIHWQMVLGEPYLKGYRLPLERQILANRVWNAEYSIYTASSEMELILLLTRAALKMRTRSAITALFGGSPHSGDLKSEYTWLMDRIDVSRFGCLARSMLPSNIVGLMESILAGGGLDSPVFRPFKKAMLRHLEPWRSYSPGHANLLRLSRELNRRLWLRMLQRMGKLTVDRRWPQSGGLIVALIGADGSGKSTQAKSLVKWLGWKIDVARVYFGSGDGPMSWHRRALLAVRSLLVRSRSKSAEAAGKKSKIDTIAATRSQITRAPGIFRTLYALSLALEKRQAIKRVVRARNSGMVVVCDRFPQNQVIGYNDGPLLADFLGRGFPWGHSAHLEKKLLSAFSSVSPDLVFKLNVSEPVAAQRKIDTPREMIQRKINAVKILEFGTNCAVLELDADQPLEGITLAVRLAVWKRL